MSPPASRLPAGSRQSWRGDECLGLFRGAHVVEHLTDFCGAVRFLDVLSLQHLLEGGVGALESGGTACFAPERGPNEKSGMGKPSDSEIKPTDGHACLVGELVRG